MQAKEVVMTDGRRDLAIKMLEEWRMAEGVARGMEGYSLVGHGTLDMVRVAAICRAEADDLREEILMLMGVDDSPAASLELSGDIAPQGEAQREVDPD